MKKSMFIAAVILVTAYLHAQTSPLPFQWHGRAMGVDFESTNLTAEARSAIKDDIAYCMSLIPATNITFNPLSPGSSGHGKYTGTIRISYTAPINYCGGVICYYKEDAGRTVFQLSPAACASYEAAIVLTNQYAAAVAALPDYLRKAMTGYDVTRMTLAEKKRFFWNPPLMEKIEAMQGNKFEEFLNDSIPDMDDPEHGKWPLPSILKFNVSSQLIPGGNPPLLSCKVIGGCPDDGDVDEFLLVHVDGHWRFCPPSF